MAASKERMPLQNELIEGEDFYYDPWGRMVFTANYLLKRGYCCGSGCRHCPYREKEIAERREHI